MKYLKILILVILLSLPAAAQLPPDTLWTKTYVDGYQSYGNCVRQTDDGGFILVSSTTQYGNLYCDVYLVKTNLDGEIVWSRTYGGALTDLGLDVKQTDDGGYIIVGYMSTFFNGADIYLIKTDENGDTLWTRVYGGEDSEIGVSVTQTLDGGYIITGNTSPNIITDYLFLYKIDANGDTTWTRIYDEFRGRGDCIIQLQDGNYIISGSSLDLGAGSGDAVLMKTDEYGERIWIHTYGSDLGESGRCVKQTYDGGFIICGHTGSGNPDVYLVKTDENGDTLWTRDYGGEDDDYGYSVDQTWDGGYIIAGMTRSFGAGSDDVYVVRTDFEGITLWTSTYGGEGPDNDKSVQQITDGGFIIAGKFKLDTPAGYRSNACLIRLEAGLTPIVQDLTIQISGDDVILNWSNVPWYLFDEYHIYRSTTPYFDVSGMTPIAVQTSNTFIDSNAVSGAYFYRVTVEY